MSESKGLETLQIGMTASAQHLSGTDRYYIELLQYLPENGIGVRGMLIGEPEAVPGTTGAIRAFAPEGASRVARWRGARETFRELADGSDVVVSHGQPHTFSVLDLMEERPLVVQFHGPWALEGRAEGVNPATTLVRHMQEVAVYRRATLFITLSNSYADVLVNSYGVDRARIRVIPGGVDSARFSSTEPRTSARARAGLPLDRPLVVTSRRLEPTKGVRVLIEAMDLVRATMPDALLLICGMGTLRASLEELVEQRDLADHVRFLGHVDSERLSTLNRAADVCVVPSIEWEGFGLSVVEALAAGTPTVVTDTGGLPEVVCDLDPSLIVEPGNPTALGDRLVRALRGEVPSDRECADYAQRFDWRVIASRVAAVYKEASQTR
ncbi:MAG: glycosyltransferase family 4 protein [Candidatus Velthaea sp.]